MSSAFLPPHPSSSISQLRKQAEPASLQLINDTHPRAGNPPPRLTWWRSHLLVDDSFEVTSDGRAATNTLRVEGVTREDLDAVFTCQAVNNNLSIPVSTSLRLDMSCK